MGVRETVPITQDLRNKRNQKAWVEENAGNAKTNVIIDKPRNISTESADDASEPGNHAATQIEDYNK